MSDSLEFIRSIATQQMELRKVLKSRAWIGGAVWYVFKNGDIVFVPYDASTRHVGPPEQKTHADYELARKLYGVKGEVIY
jgi:hypothetical protein